MIASQLMLTEAWLSKWFVNNYIRKCSLLSPENVASLFRDISTNTKLQNAVSALVRWRPCIALKDACLELVSAEFLVSREEFYNSLNVRSFTCWMSELPKIYTCLSHYFSAITFLYVAYKMSRIGFTDELMDVLSAAVGQVTIERHHRSQCSSELSKATKLMKVVANSSRSTTQLIQIELSKAYLYKALSSNDCDSDSSYCLANVYLAVLYYTTGQYQTAIDHCTLVTRSQDHSQCSSHTVQGELLPKIDNDIDNILGLTVFYEYVLSTALNQQQQQRQYLSVFTTEIFAYYLHCRLLFVTQCNQATQMSLFNVRQLCAKCISEMHELVIGDVLVFKSFNCALEQCVSDKPECGRSAVNETELSTADLTELLQQSAVERLTTYRQLVAQDFDPVVTTVTTDFEALYAYKHGDYQRCLQLSTQNVHTLLYGFCWISVSTCEAFVQLLDDDIVSLTALTLLVDPKCRYYSNNACISQLTLSLYLMTQCHLKLRHSVTLLAQTLDYIRLARRRQSSSKVLDQLTLTLTERKATTYLNS